MADLLPTYSIYISPTNLRELKKDIWLDKAVPAKLMINREHYEIDIAYRGNHIREFKKKSYQIYFHKPYQNNRELHLNAEFLDASLIRSKLSFDFFEEIGVFTPSAKHIFLKVNGMNAGVYLEIESVDLLFFQKRGIPIEAIYYAENSDADFSMFSAIDKGFKVEPLSGYVTKFGSTKEDHYLREFILKINTLSNDDFPKEVVKYLNVEQFLRWFAGVVCIQNFDAFHQNYALALNSETGHFQMLPWDNEGTWGRDCNGEEMEYDYVPITGDNTNVLANRLLEYEIFRKKYKKIMEEILHQQFTEENLLPKISSMRQLLLPYIRGSNIDFSKEFEVIIQFIRDRNRYLRTHLIELN